MLYNEYKHCWMGDREQPTVHRRADRRRLLLLAAGVGMGLGGLSALPFGHASDLDLRIVRRRAEAFWEARKAGDLITQYEYEEVNARNELTLQQYVRKAGSLLYNKADIREIKRISEDRIDVFLDLEVILPALSADPIKQSLRDVWTRIDGQWYHGDIRRFNER